MEARRREGPIRGTAEAQDGGPHAKSKEEEARSIGLSDRQEEEEKNQGLGLNKSYYLGSVRSKAFCTTWAFFYL